MIHLRALPLPCPVNRLYRAVPMRLKSGHTISKQVLSKQARMRRDLVVAAIWKQLGGRPQPMTGDVQVSYTVTPRDRRTPDCDAHAKQLLDCLAHAGVIANDRQVVHIAVERLPPQHPGHLDVQISEVGG